MEHTNALLFANEVFYVAFASADIDSMEAIWSRKHPVTCIHPGWRPLIGREAVLESWSAILSSRPPCIRFSHPVGRLFEGAGYVICDEHLERGKLIATNVFVYENGFWKMVHHHAGISPAAGDDEEETREPMQ